MGKTHIVGVHDRSHSCFYNWFIIPLGKLTEGFTHVVTNKWCLLPDKYTV